MAQAEVTETAMRNVSMKALEKTTVEATAKKTAVATQKKAPPRRAAAARAVTPLAAHSGPSSHFAHPQGLCESPYVGPRTRIWAFAHVLPGARLGAD
jgi:hypothetical protein